MGNFKKFLEMFEANDTEVLKDVNPDSPGGNLVNNAYHAIKQKNATAAQDFVNKAKQVKDMAGLDKLKKDYYSRYGAKDIDNIYEAGYDYGKGMSNNAVSAYNNGEKPKSKWAKEEIIQGVSDLFANPTAYDKREYGDFLARKDEVMDIVRKLPLARLKEVLLIKSSWHHTSKYYNATDFYSLPSDISELYDALYQNDLFEKKVVWEGVISKVRLLEFDRTKNLRFPTDAIYDEEHPEYNSVPEEARYYVTVTDEIYRDLVKILDRMGATAHRVNAEETETGYIRTKIAKSGLRDRRKRSHEIIVDVFRSQLWSVPTEQLARKIISEVNDRNPEVLESILPELKKIDKICQIDSRYDDTYLYLGLKGEYYGIYADKRVKKFNGYAWDYSLISPAFTSKGEALEWAKGYLTKEATLEDVKEMYQEGIFKVFDDDFKQVLNLEGEGGKHTISIWPKSRSKGIDPLPKYMTMGNGSARNVERINYIKATGRPSEYEN